MTLIPILTGGGGKFIATGGIEYVQSGYKYHIFTSDGNFTISRGTTTIEYLAVGGGGGGGLANGPSGNGQYTATGGGGGGQVVYGSRTAANLQISIGAGGDLGNGGETSILVVPGGIFSPFPLANAYGGGYGATGSAAALVGTSGGGGSVTYNGTTQTTYAAANGTSGQGFAGSASSTSIPSGGAGGGAGGAASGVTPGTGINTYSSWSVGIYSADNLGAGAPGGTAFGDVFISNWGWGGKGAYSADNALQNPGDGTAGIVFVRYAV